MSSFITNSGKKRLKGRIEKLISLSSELKFLIGFFYFSGFRELYDALKSQEDLEIKILVGLSVDKTIHGLLEYEDKESKTTKSREDAFFSSIKNSLQSEEFDSQVFYEQIDFFIRLIEEDRLKIRKTKAPNHAKLYIFKLQNPVPRESVFLTGSSNLTRPGINTQNEFNVEISDYGTKEAEDYFDTLWMTADKITEYEELKRKLISLIQKGTLIAKVTPFEAFAFILKTFLDVEGKKEESKTVEEILASSGYKNYRYQKDAVSQALSIIEDYNGVIVADVVGLGKSVIASRIVKSLNKKGVVICSPGLIGDSRKKDSGWWRYLKDFRLSDDWTIYSTGELERALKDINENGEYEVVIIDEAHRFKNQDTENYERLQNICRGKIVILLTATPFNNAPSDIFSMLKLFIIPKKSKITLSDNLEGQFRRYQKAFSDYSYIIKNYKSPKPQNKKKAEDLYVKIFNQELPIDIEIVKESSKRLAHEIRRVITPVLIRRNRIDLLNDVVYSKEIYDLPEVQKPVELFFELNKAQSIFYDEILENYFGENEIFKGAIYRPYWYETAQNTEDAEFGLEENREKQQQDNLFDFMRRLLVKRFESSFGAFAQSIQNFIRVNKNVLKFVKKNRKYILDRKLIEDIYDKDEETVQKELEKYSLQLEKDESTRPKKDKIYDIDKFKKAEAFIADIESDLAMFRKIALSLEEMKLTENDPKATCLLKAIEEDILENKEKNEPRRKVIIFTEYADTVKHLQEQLQEKFAGRTLVISGDFDKKAEALYANFDGAYKKNKQKDDFDILLTTDKISEGFNLSRAGAVINYDIPWNPTRVIQRVGRINRLGQKVFQKLYIYNFFPTEQGADHVKSRQIAGEKMFLIHNILGEDVRIFDHDEEPTASRLFQRVTESVDAHDEECFETTVRRAFSEIEKNHPEIIEKIKLFAPRVKTAKRSTHEDMNVFIRKGHHGLFVRSFLPEGGVIETDLESVFSNIKCGLDEPRLELSNNFWERYEKARDHKDSFQKATSEQSVEVQARNNLKTIINRMPDELLPHIHFLEMLLEDIEDYGILSTTTLRRIKELKISTPDQISRTIKELNSLQDKMGINYLELSKKQNKAINTEVIIAIENQR